MELSTQDAINYVLKNDKNANLTRLAQAIGATPPTIRSMANGETTMTLKWYKGFSSVYPSIKITDIRTDKKVCLGKLEGVEESKETTIYQSKYSVYQLKFEDGTSYIGCTSDIEKRMISHRHLQAVGFTEEILFQTDSESLAYEIEELLIRCLGSNLTNIKHNTISRED